MKKQKVCVIGGGLTGLITALCLSKLNIEVDLVCDDIKVNKKFSRTIAISQNNLEFLKKLKLYKFLKKDFWPCSTIKLYSKNNKKDSEEIFELNNNKLGKKIFYVIENWKIINFMLKEISKNKLISFKKQKKVTKIGSGSFLKSLKFNNKITSKYNLIILCTGSNSDLVKKIFNNKIYKHEYAETSIITMIKHQKIKNNIARQVFLDDEILALLPISNTATSIVLSTKKELIQKYKKKNSLFKNKIKFYSEKFIKKIKFQSPMQYRNLHFILSKKYFFNRILLFGDALHSVHPFVGQGYNMILRDLIILEEVLKNKINLGLDIGSEDALLDFSEKTKSANFAYSFGIDFLKNIFSFKKEYIKKFRNKILIAMNNNNLSKKFFYNIADKGFRF